MINNYKQKQFRRNSSNWHLEEEGEAAKGAQKSTLWASCRPGPAGAPRSKPESKWGSPLALSFDLQEGKQTMNNCLQLAKQTFQYLTSNLCIMAILLGDDCIRIDQAAVFSLLDSLANINTILLLNQSNQLIRIFANDHGAEMASNVVPFESILILVVQHCQASFIMVFLKSFNGNADVELRLNGSFLDTLEVVRLGSSRPGT